MSQAIPCLEFRSYMKNSLKASKTELKLNITFNGGPFQKLESLMVHLSGKPSFKKRLNQVKWQKEFSVSCIMYLDLKVSDTALKNRLRLYNEDFHCK